METASSSMPRKTSLWRDRKQPSRSCWNPNGDLIDDLADTMAAEEDETSALMEPCPAVLF